MSPYVAPPDDAKSTCSTLFAATAPCMRLSSPPTFTSASKRGSDMERRTSICAAWWQTTCGLSFSIASSAAALRTSTG